MIGSPRRPQIEVGVLPTAVRPRQSIQVTVTAARPVDKVTAARVELGYHNFYRYRWAGRADAAAAHTEDPLWLAGQVGTSYGTDRDTHDWVGVLSSELPVTNGEFCGGAATFRIPSWAPGSSEAIARWCARVVVVRRGRDVSAEGSFAVVISRADVAAAVGGCERIGGDGAADIEIALAESIYRAGETITGQMTVTAATDLPDGELGVFWQRHRSSHPLERTPGLDVERDGPVLHLEKRLALRANVPVRIPFALPLPADAAPTAEAVHSSIDWCVQARMFYKGWTAPAIERVRHPFVMVTAPDELH